MIKDQHIPIMAIEILSFINRKKNLSILDCTFGGGGHSKKFLENGHIVTAIDQDDNSLLIAKQLKKNFPNIIKEVRGVGLLIGLQLFKDQTKFIKKLMNHKLLTIKAAENVIRILPPLTVKKKEIDLAVTILEKVCKTYK